jgi:hypothetical protein
MRITEVGISQLVLNREGHVVGVVLRLVGEDGTERRKLVDLAGGLPAPWSEDATLAAALAVD